MAWAFGSNSVTGILTALWLFFTAFNILEASLPSMMSKLSPLENKGTALGIYSTAQFLGAFIGGAAGGFLYGHFDVTGVFIAGAVITLIWLFFVFPMNQPRHLSTKIIELPQLNADNASHTAQLLNAIDGVIETMIVAEEQVAYVKYAAEELDMNELDAFHVSSS